MSEHNPRHSHGGHGQDHEHEQVETSAVAPKPVLMFLAILFISTAFVFIIVKGLDYGFRKLDESNKDQKATQVQTGERQLPPEPMLQGAPGKGDKPTLLPLEDMARVRNETNEKINSFGWVDKTGGIARIPIDNAKNMIAEKGLPALPSATISEELQKAQTVRNEVLNAGSNAGRMIKIPGQNQQPVQQPTQQPAQQPAQQPVQQPARQPAQPQEKKPEQKQQQVPPQQH
jgi:hypothetical protein